MSDPYDNYTEDVIEYLNMLREYTGEGGIFPTKLPVVADVPRGFFEVQPCVTPIDDFVINRSIGDLMDDTCPVCQDEFKHENEVITTYCSHAFHTSCLLPWLSQKNTCPTCRAVLCIIRPLWTVNVESANTTC
ncbi:E3 ubiquitin-protein ligase SGR9, amyloplastic-like [Lycium ferocissimum]|uniref:E3 ubiquitin-protein ligase SGR9, amyloplastic-like n=1 Tax=Lycium ferocissimum TaxID=112874 RepID=UPI00281606A3|nr:E3 ubiquitin-protein ligase SGR9, amyloplastic-like [Lycium ferocissimum]